MVFWRKGNDWVLHNSFSDLWIGNNDLVVQRKGEDEPIVFEVIQETQNEIELEAS